MKAKTEYNKKIANRFHDTKYYESNEYYIKNQESFDNESSRLKTKKQEKVTEIIDEKRQYSEEKVFNLIERLYEKNKTIAFGKDKENEQIFNSDLLNIVSSIPLLMVSYAKVRKNPGSTTIAYFKQNDYYNTLNSDQKNFLNRTDKGSDGIDMHLFMETSKLIKMGKYPWGTSRRIYLDKPGKPGSKRPITIPPFMDRVVQEAIRTVLAAIYEPYFDKMNCSFGFRPNVGVHDAIFSLTNQLAQGLDKALEGDIKSAYDKVNRDKLIEILGKKIKDKKFLNLIRDRLDYDYYDTEKEIYVKDKEGIPQGGTDSPYLWNIYMLEFDNFIMNDIKLWIKEINMKNRGFENDSAQKKIKNTQKETLRKHKSTVQKLLSWIWFEKGNKGTFKEKLVLLKNTDTKKWRNLEPFFGKHPLKNIKTFLEKCNLSEYNEKEIIQTLQKILKKIIHIINNLPYYDLNRKFIRFIYARYADDWIIITNAKYEIVEMIKKKAGLYLNDNLSSTLSEEKTMITDMKKQPAHFLGFEIRTYKENRIIKKKYKSKDGTEKEATAQTAGMRVFAGIDKQRLIDRLHMKGYCTKDGFPREITKLNNLEAFTIIDRTNSVLSGLTRYYATFIKDPKSELSRWIYIIRYSCLKTLALKHKSTLRKIFKKFRPKEDQASRTVEDTVILEINGEKYYKTWRLETLTTLIKKCSTKSAQLKRKEIIDRYWSLVKSIPIQYGDIQKTTVINSDDFLNRINWVNIRTQSNFDLPCCICGSETNIEMHHIKHVRKTKYGDIDKEKPWHQVMALRNRRQIPVCRFCHMYIIHTGKYRGKSLLDFSVNKLYDNRVINSESYIHTGRRDTNYKKSLLSKGWKLVQDTENIEK